ncbi:hypothetical protein ACFT9I_07060 [Streptomyces sp. NPDC057137]|uniref:hypothetical protein n=1 Tax=Streptomyces sp. NPDC057137 TaxID=3346030 RepID=UPI00364282DB
MRTLRSAGILLLLWLAAGCTSPLGGASEEKKALGMDMQEAAVQADSIMLKTLNGVRPELRWNHGPSIDSRCGDAPDTGSVKRRIAVMTIVSKERRGSLLGVVERNWKGRGYQVTSVRASEELPAMYASTPDGFRMRIAVAGEGQFFFSITTPCFTESDVADPKTRPNTPHREGGYPQRPDIHDDFWSAPTPPPRT